MPASAGTRTYSPIQEPPPSRRWVIDLCMPGSGIEFLEKAIAQHSDTGVVLMSGTTLWNLL